MKFEVGDIVTIKQWDTMVEEYGYSDIAKDTVIKVPGMFTISMKKYCGKQFKIIRKQENSRNSNFRYYLKDFNENVLVFLFSEEMFDMQKYIKINNNLKKSLDKSSNSFTEELL